METHAKHIAVGIFVLALILGIAMFCLWAANVQTKSDFARYYTRFSGSVAQLRVDSSVLFGGIPVGRVVDVRIDPDNTELARVDIDVRNGTPIRKDSTASLELQGLAGGVALQISRGSNKSELLKPGQEIQSASSPLERLARQMPNLLDKATQMADRLNAMLSNENQQAFTASMQNLQQLTDNLAQATKNVPAVMKNADQAMQNLADAGAKFDQLATQLQGTVSSVQGDFHHTVQDVSKMAQSFTQAANQLNSTIEENRAPLKQFTGSALYETGELVTQLRQLVSSMSRIAQQF
jgi:phospholipid/cholesterol/gamma-HCH transport system substrate-binding protein